MHGESTSRVLFNTRREVKAERGKLERSMRSFVKRLALMLPPIGPFSRLPQEFGVYVRMIRDASKTTSESAEAGAARAE